MRIAPYFKGIAVRLILLIAGASVIALAAEPDGKEIQDVRLDRASFDPSSGQAVELAYVLAKPAAVTIEVFDPDGGLIRTLAENLARHPGPNSLSWDGRDDGGRIVPDEAYTFRIRTDDGALYDSHSFSGGEVGDLTDARFDAFGTLSYRLPAAARVLIRLGVHNGPMYDTLVDWKPRPAGKVNEAWDGFDQDGLVKLLGRKDFSALITYATLPEATVIAYGNKTETYRAYKLGRGKDRPGKPKRAPGAGAEPRHRADALVPPAWTHAPRVALTFPEFPSTDAVPQVKRTVDVRIDVTEADKSRLMEDQFEVLLFVDSQFFAEAERGYLPLNWKWELQQFSLGEHILTVNISSFKGQVGVASRKIILEK